MLISVAHAMDNSSAGTGSSGGAIALTIILGTGILAYVLYAFGKRWRKRRLDRGAGQ